MMTCSLQICVSSNQLAQAAPAISSPGKTVVNTSASGKANAGGGFSRNVIVNNLMKKSGDYIAHHHGREGIRWAKNALTIEPDCAMAQLLLGCAYYKAEEPDMAIPALKKGLAQVEDYGANIYIFEGASDCRPANDYALALFETGKEREAIAFLDKAIPKFKNASTLYVARGNIHSQLNEIDKAISDYDHAIAGDKSFKLYHYRAKTYIRKKNYGKALTDINSAIKLCPTDSMLYAERAKIYKLLGNLEAAKKDMATCQSLGSKGFDWQTEALK